MSDANDAMDPMKEITIGAISGMFGKLVEFPFDTIKVRLQSSKESLLTIGMIRKTYNQEGIINGFYKGLKTPLIGACMETAVLFTSFEWSSAEIVKYMKNTQNVHYTNDSLPLWCKCISGAFAGFACSFVLTPVELVKCQLQVANLSAAGKDAGYLSVVKNILEKDSIFGLWKGLSSTLLREVAGTSIWFGTYEYVNAYLLKKESWASGDARLLVSGASAGIAFNFSMFPIDTIKSNIQTHDVLHGDNKPGSGILQVAKHLVTKKGGITNLYSGLTITLLRSAPANALIFYTYELLKRNF